MKKKFARLREINARLRAMAETLRTEKRQRTEEETNEFNELLREKQLIEIELAGEGISPATAVTQRQRQTLTQYVRARLKEDPTRPIEILLREGEGGGAGSNETPGSTTVTPDVTGVAVNTHVTDDLDDGALQPLTIGEILNPVEAELIWHKIGVRIPTGLSGRYEWPVVGDIEGTFIAEGEELEAQKIDLDSIAAIQQRIGVYVRMTSQSIFNSNGKIESIARERMPHSIVRDINKMLFSRTQLTNCKIKGPLVGKTAKSLTAPGNKTFKELNVAKAGLLGEGYSAEGMVWVMTEATKAILEATPKDAGSGIMVIENDRLCGLPVYCTPYIGENNICLGDWRYQVCGQFGTPRFIVDPYSEAAKDLIKLVLNTDYGTATLRSDAFELYTFATA